jgi:hypothetical protein
VSIKKTISSLIGMIRSSGFGGAPASIMRAILFVGLLLPSLSSWAAVNTFQQGVGGYGDTQDTYVDEEFPAASQGGASSVLVENNIPQRQHGLIRFDNLFGAGPGQIPFGSVINSATLTVNVTNASDPPAQIRLHRMLVTWAESATWTSMSAGIQTNDVEAMSAFDAQVASPALSGSQVITGLAAALQAWSGGATNFGWAVISNSTDGWDFSSSENGTTGDRPLLTVDWTAAACPGGVVTTTADSGDSSLRACINFANNNPGTTISFNIPGPGNRSAGPNSWWAISPLTPLPTITAVNTFINGIAQTANQGNTNSIGPEIELDGALAGGGTHGLDFGATSDGSTVRGIMINRFGANGIQIQAGANDVTVAGNWIGSDGSGASAPRNGNNGIILLGANATIGGTGAGDRNVINNNGNEGINLTGGGATGNTILGNYIGLEYDGSSGSGNGDVGIALLPGAAGNTIGGLTPASRNVISMNFEGLEINTANNVILGNYIGTDAGGTLDRGSRSDDGLELQGAADNKTIGGTAPGAANLIAFSQLHGVNIAGGSNNTILGNRIHSNDLRGIDLGNNGVTANDAGDGDSGPNALLNFPVITSAIESGGTLVVEFDLDVPAGNYRIEFFTNPSGADPSGNGEGELFADAVTITHGGTGVESFNRSFAGSGGDILTATATQEFAGPSYGSTSEFSAAFTAVILPVCPGGVVTTTADSVAGGSLRACIIWANGNPGVDTLNVPVGTYTLTILGTGEDAAVTGDLDITDDIVINGDGVGSTIIDASGIDRVMQIQGANLSASNLTVRNGNGTSNGAGIALDLTASLTLSASTVSGNTTTVEGGGIASAGGVVTLSNVTISGNTAVRGGGLDCAGPCTLTNATVTENTAPSNGGGVRQRTGSGSITFLNTIVANNISAGAVDCDGNPSLLFSNGNNLSSDASCDFTTAGDQENTNPLLGPLQDNGGPTFTHELLAGSPAIEAGTNTGCPATDQRGIARPIGVTCDVGSFEAAVPQVCPGGVVTTIADTGASSLRDCIAVANGSPGSTVSFNIPGPGNRSAGGDTWWGISPLTPLPAVTAAGTVIDGTTQTINQGDTNSRGPEVEIDGAGAGAVANGLVLGASAGGSTIRGLAIGNFIDSGILLSGGSNLIAGNYLGLSADGDTVAANNSDNTPYQAGIRVESASNTIGGTTAADRNVLSGNGFAGIELFGAGATANQVYGNYVGVDATGAFDRGNEQEGIDLELSSSNQIGGPLPGQRNIISGNGSDGVEIDGGDLNQVWGNYIGTDITGTVIIPNDRDGVDVNENGGDPATNNLIGGVASPNDGNLIRGNGIYGVQVRGAGVIDNTIHGNRIFGNVALDIDLNDDGVTVNDPLDADAGSNESLNYPEMISAQEGGGAITVYFSLDVPAGIYRIEFFRNPSGAHGSGTGGGEVIAGSRMITHTGGGVRYFVHSFAGSAGDIITATATEQIGGPFYGSTSEFSAAFTATAFSPFSARWPLDETSGVIAADIDAGNDGTYRNGVLLSQTAACPNTGNAVHFDGINDYVEVPHSPDYLMNEGTVTLWANVDALGTQQGLFSKDSTGFDTGGHLTILLPPGGNVQVRLQTTTADNFVNSAPIAPATWTHVAFSWGPAGMALYIDGAAPVTNPYTGGLGVTSGGAGNFEPIAFGANTWVSGDLVATPTVDHFAGYMDDVRIYNRALTQPEIITLANCAGSLDIVKRAFWPDGTPIPTGATIPSGVEFKYLLYINNPGVARTDITIRDVLDPAFLYQAGTIQVDNSLAECGVAVCTPVEEQAIFTAVGGAAVVSDAIDLDVASFTVAGTTIDAGNGNVGNLQLDINGSAVWAILFSAKMP